MVKPFRGNVSVGMKCQCVRSSLSKANVARCRCSGVRLSKNRVPAAAIAAGEGPPASARPNVITKSAAAANQRVVNERFIRLLVLQAQNFTPSVAFREVTSDVRGSGVPAPVAKCVAPGITSHRRSLGDAQVRPYYRL